MGVCASKGLLRRRRGRRKEPDSDIDFDVSSLFDIFDDNYYDRIRRGENDDPAYPPGESCVETRRGRTRRERTERQRSRDTVRVTALFSFEGEYPEDLHFSAGDHMVVSEQDWFMRGLNWMRALNLRTRTSGLIPKNYVRRLRREASPIPSNSSGGLVEYSLLDKLWLHILQNSPPQMVSVRRNDAVRDFLQYLARPEFHVGKRIHVTFVNEEGVDQGGLTRDLASSILQHLQYSQVFEGPTGAMCLSHNLGALSRQEYLRAGQLVAFVLCHASMACLLFSESLVNLLCGGAVEGLPRDPSQSQSQQPDSKKTTRSLRQRVLVKVEDVPDVQFRQRLQEIESSDDFPCPLALEVAEEIGFYDPLNADRKAAFLNAACHYYLYHRCRSEIEQFKAGLNQLGILGELQENLEEAHTVLCGSHTVALTANDVFQLFMVVWDSPAYSEERQDEEVTHYEFEFFLHECANGDSWCSLSDVLYFVTGSRIIPPGGFRLRPTLNFARVPYPRVSTCTLELTLPLCLPPDKTLKDVMELAVSSPEFAIA